MYVYVFLTVNDESPGALHHDPAASGPIKGDPLLDPTDGRAGGTSGLTKKQKSAKYSAKIIKLIISYLARKNSNGVHGECLVGRAHGDDRRRLQKINFFK